MYQSNVLFDDIRLLVLLICFINSFYSACWDVFVDWSINPFKKRSKLLFSDNTYILLVILNTSLRFVWILKLTSLKIKNIDNVFNSIEVIRRLIWVVLRIESEFIEMNKI